AEYVDSVLGIERSTSEVVGDSTVEHGNLGSLREAVVLVEDVFTVRRVRKLGGLIVDSVVQDRTLDRYGFFLKLGNDAQSFVGWKLWGFNGLGTNEPPPVLTVKLPNGHVIQGGLGLYSTYPESGYFSTFGSLAFIRLDQVDTVGKGVNAIMEATPKVGNPLVFFHTYCMATDSGLQTRNMTRLGTNHFLDTVKTASTISRTYNLLYMQSYLESDRRWVWSWCIPYHVR
ncbi:MAG TPA: hypothetical protein VMS71_03780, partial [Candidatus Acidoferrum sp.]|nr:hypothetical protein [Candidatus Acidoferrum sp.]